MPPNCCSFSFRRVVLAASTALLLNVFPADAETTAVLPSADTYPRNSTTTTNYGSDTFFVANNANGLRLSYIRFDLSSFIFAEITGLKLELTVGTGLAAVGQTFNVYGLTAGENWEETTLNWTNAPAVINTYTTTTGAMADYIDTAELFNTGQVLSTFTSGAAGTKDVAFDVTSGPIFSFLAADADKVVTFVIAEPDPSDISGVGWNSREAASGKPTLTVTTIPEPGAAALLVVALGGLAVRRRRSK